MGNTLKKRFKLRTPKQRLDVRIPKGLKRALEEYCDRTGQGQTTAIVRAIKELIKYKDPV
jgi:hypothetical protein